MTALGVYFYQVAKFGWVRKDTTHQLKEPSTPINYSAGVHYLVFGFFFS